MTLTTDERFGSLQNEYACSRGNDMENITAGGFNAVSDSNAGEVLIASNAPAASSGLSSELLKAAINPGSGAYWAIGFTVGDVKSDGGRLFLKTALSKFGVPASFSEKKHQLYRAATASVGAHHRYRYVRRPEQSAETGN
ncbi:MAG: hypothetical protein HC779_00245 [Phyllobacteriaceae bacterium]|nr:hypothetical protein [Phyllobacteriaceae bacterium]